MKKTTKTDIINVSDEDLKVEYSLELVDGELDVQILTVEDHFTPQEYMLTVDEMDTIHKWILEKHSNPGVISDDQKAQEFESMDNNE